MDFVILKGMGFILLLFILWLLLPHTVGRLLDKVKEYLENHLTEEGAIYGAVLVGLLAFLILGILFILSVPLLVSASTSG